MFEPPFMPHQLMEAVWGELGISVSNVSRGVVTDSRAGSDSLRDMTAFKLESSLSAERGVAPRLF
jgi:hypothetical protein